MNKQPNLIAPRHFLDIDQLSAQTLRSILNDSLRMKGLKNTGSTCSLPLAGKTLAMIFAQPSTRTRVSFDVGMRQMGGETIILSGKELQLHRGESIADTARVLSRYVDAVMIRIHDDKALREFAEAATVPVINALTNHSHPCQVMADVMTFEEHRGPIKDRKIAWSGDGNNVVTSWIHAAERFGFGLSVASPKMACPNDQALKKALDAGAKITVTEDPDEAVAHADCVVTDVWISMGEDEQSRHNELRPYQVNEHLLAKANEDAIFMHCLPAHRGEEVTAGVMDGPQSVVFDEAENRLHIQKGILAWCFGVSVDG